MKSFYMFSGICVECFILFKYITRLDKRYLMIDQQIARHFVHFSKCLYTLLPFCATQLINPFLTAKIIANHNKRL